MPDWLQTATVAFPSGRTAEELVANDAAHLVWAVNLGVIDFNPWPARRADLDHPDELRVDLDPTPGVGWDEVRRTAMVVHEVLAEHGLRGYPKTSGSKGIHVNVRIEPRVEPPRRAPRGARAGARGRAARARPRDEQVVEGGAPRRVRRLQPERARPHGRVLLLRPPDAGRARVVRAELGRGARRRAGRPAARHGARAPAHGRRPGRATSTSGPARSTQLLELARRDEEEGLGDAPWPPHFPKQKGEPKRVQPSRDRDRPTHRGRAGDPQPGGPPPGVSLGGSQRGFGSKPRTGQGHEHEFDE